MFLVFCNCPTKSASEIAREVVQKKLAACVNVTGPVKSVYRWNGAIEEADEVTLICKTSEKALPALRARLAALHPYDVPEIVAIADDPRGTLASYSAWVDAETAEPSRSE